MQWAPDPGAGFTSGEAWLPIAAGHEARNVEKQRWDPGSMLHLYRDLIALRRATPALERGSFAWLEGDQDVLAWERREGSSRVLVALNFGEAPAEARLPEARVTGGLHTGHGSPLPARSGSIALPPCEGVVLVVATD